jgi:hypothetical protein
MFFFFVSIVREDRLELRILAGIDPLVIPVDRLELFHQRCDGAMHIARGIAEIRDFLVVTFVCHF